MNKAKLLEKITIAVHWQNPVGYQFVDNVKSTSSSFCGRSNDATENLVTLSWTRSAAQIWQHQLKLPSWILFISEVFES